MCFHGDIVTANGYLMQPQSVTSLLDTPHMSQKRKDPLLIVAENLRRCMESPVGPNSQLGIHKLCKLSQSTVGRTLAGTNDLRVSTLDNIAELYNLHAWHLLVPDLDPQNPPVLRGISADEEQLYQRLREAAQGLAELKKK